MRKKRLGQYGMAVINSAKTHCILGHPLNGDNISVRWNRRVCITCRKLRKSAAYVLAKAARKQSAVPVRGTTPRHFHPLFGVWRGMLERCRNPKNVSYKYYGGRGIAVCERWKDIWLFAEDMGPRPSRRHSIDRINNDGNYEPGNCRWATQQEQVSNSRRSLSVARRKSNGIGSEVMP